MFELSVFYQFIYILINIYRLKISTISRITKIGKFRRFFILFYIHFWLLILRTLTIGVNSDRLVFDIKYNVFIFYEVLPKDKPKTINT